MDRLRTSQTSNATGYGFIHLNGYANGTNNLTPDDAGFIIAGFNSPIFGFAFEQVIDPSEEPVTPVQTEYTYKLFSQPLFEPVIYISPRNGAGGVAEGNGGFSLVGNPFFGNPGTAICEIITYDEDQRWNPATLCWNNQPAPKADAIALTSLLVTPPGEEIQGGFFFGVLDCRGTGKTICGIRLRCEKPEPKTDDQVVASGDFVSSLIYDGTPPLTTLDVVSRSSSTTTQTLTLSGPHGLYPGALIQAYGTGNNQYDVGDVFGHNTYIMVTGTPTADSLTYTWGNLTEPTTPSTGTIAFYPTTG